MKNKITIIFMFSLVIVLSIFLLNMKENKKIIYNENHKDLIVNSNTLTMMYETEVDSGEYQISSDNSWPIDGYVFNETLSKCENGSILTWDNENKKILMQASTSDKCYIYFDKTITLTNYIITKIYVEDGLNNMYYHDGNGIYGIKEAGDNSYRYSGENPNNYICFGTKNKECLEDNLYRIIGVFKNNDKYEIKIQKNAEYEYLSWDTSNNNEWKTSSLNNELNTNFINTLSDYQKFIMIHTWKIKKNTFSNSLQQNINSIYNSEVNFTDINNEYEAKIGLMYVSDYGYAASPEYWDAISYETNWLYKGMTEWTISSRLDGTGTVFYLYKNGGISSKSSLDRASVYPVFYLNSDVLYVSGDGSVDNPFRIA